MKKLTVFIVFIVLALSLALSATPVYAVPALPHAFYGSVSINGAPAPPGTSVEARGTGIMTGIEDNPTVTTASGIYGTSNPFQHRLIVQGDIEEGATITFYVNGISTGQTAEWHSGETTEVNLTVTIAEEVEVDVEVTVAPTIQITLLGQVVSFRISAAGVILETITVTSEDGNVSITIPAGTIALNKDGEPLSSLTVDVDPSPPDPPEGGNIIGIVYDFGPEGATFEPPITVTFAYDPDEVPEDTKLVVMEWDEDADQWVEIPEDDYTVNTEDHTVELLVSGFSKYAIIARAVIAAPLIAPAPAVFSLSNLTVQPVEIEAGKAVTIAITVANAGGTQGSYTVVLQINGVKEAEKSVTVAAGSSEIVTFSTTREMAGSYIVTVDGMSAGFTVVVSALPPPKPPVEEEEEVPAPAEPSFNWPLFGGVTAAVIVAILLVYFLAVKRRAY